MGTTLGNDNITMEKCRQKELYKTYLLHIFAIILHALKDFSRGHTIITYVLDSFITYHLTLDCKIDPFTVKIASWVISTSSTDMGQILYS